jgi:hypothetical protein
VTLTGTAAAPHHARMISRHASLAIIVALVVIAGCQPPGAPPAGLPGGTVDVPTPTHVLAATPPPSPPAVPGPSAARTANKRGVHLLLDDGGSVWAPDVWDDHITWSFRLVGPGGYVVQLIRSDDLRPATWQRFFDAVARERLVPIIRVATSKDPGTGDWVAPTPDADGPGYRDEAERLRAFLEAINWRGGVVFATVGNEPNRADEWGGGADPAAYARYLRDAATALRRVSSMRVLVLNGALDAYAPSTDGPTGRSLDAELFLEGVEAEVPGLLASLDGWASHAYPLGPFVERPGRQEFRIDDRRATPRPRTGSDALPNRGINGYAWELETLARLGVGRALPVYVTETGWRHARSQAPKSGDAAGATLADRQVADYVSEAFDGPAAGPAVGWTPWNDDPRVRAVVLFALGGRPEHWGHTNLAVVAPTGRILGLYPFAEQLRFVRPGDASRTVHPGPSPRATP